jgi:magnesium transporter
MIHINTDTILEKIQQALDDNDLNGAINVLAALRPMDQAEVFDDLNDEDQISLLPVLVPAVSADILENLDEADAAELVESIPQDSAIRIINEMEPDEAADLLGDIDPDQAKIFLESLENPDEVRPLLLHPDESAGGLMTSEYLALRCRMTAADAIAALRTWHPDSDELYYLFVIDSGGELSGVVGLRQLIIAEPYTRLEDIMDPDVISVLVGSDQEECARLMTHYDLVALPVVDSGRHLLGVITVDDVIDVIVDEATEDIQRLGGAQPLTTPYLDTSVRRVSRSRIGWLALLFLTGSLTGTVIQNFQNALEAVVALSIFIPLLIGTGGNAGSQTTSTIIRAFALGEINFRDSFKAMWHEFRVGLLLGLGLAIFGYFRSITWVDDHGLAITVAISILVIVIWANVMGSILPLIVARLKMDPTVVSGPVMSTLVDATGLFIYFSIAQLILKI